MSQIVIRLNSAWVLDRSMDDALPAEVISKFVNDNKLGTVVKQEFTELVINLESENALGLQGFRSQLVSHLCKVYQLTIQQALNAVTVSAKEDSEKSKEPQKDKDQGKPEDKPADKAKMRKREKLTPEALSEMLREVEKLQQGKTGEPEEPDAPKVSIMEEIRALHGAEQFIALCESIRKTAPVFRQRNLQPICTSMCYLFSMDKGCGYSTMLRLLSGLMQEESLMTVKMEPYEFVLEPEGANKEVLSNASRMLSNCSNRVVSIDISNWCDKVSSPEFRDFLVGIHSLKKEAVYVFRLPYLEHSVLERIEEAMLDVMRVQKVVFPPMTATALQEISRKKLQKQGFSATPEAWELFQLRLAEEKSDGRFYGIRTAEKILEDMIFLKVQAIAAGNGGDENCITAEDLSTLTDDPKQNLSAEEC